MSYAARSDIPMICEFKDSSDNFNDVNIAGWNVEEFTEETSVIDLTNESYKEVVSYKENIYRIVEEGENKGVVCVGDTNNVYIESQVKISGVEIAERDTVGDNSAELYQILKSIEYTSGDN
jgi:predicted DNA-binding ArsR family transcriptional regulator